MSGLHAFTGGGVLKTASWGYDGKGQAVVRKSADVTHAWERLFGKSEVGSRKSEPEDAPAIIESLIDFEYELSVVAVRGLDGQVLTYGPILNTHAQHILDVSLCPAPLPDRVARSAIEIARGVVQALDVVGVLCVEFFLTKSGELLINETAPRPHNSGHLTIDAHVTCQFEQQVRAVCGLPLGSTRQLRPAAMANLLGDRWEPGPVDWSRVLADSDIKLHLYGKQAARPGRKMGHLTALAETIEQAEQHVRHARDRMTG